MAEKDNLYVRVLKAKGELNKLGVKMPRYYFCLKYPEYKAIDSKLLKDNHKLDNLWYGKITDEDFTVKLEAFVKYKSVGV